MKRIKPIDFLHQFSLFIRHSRQGKRLQPNGKKVSAGTLVSYGQTLRILQEFANEKQFELRLMPVRRMGKRELQAEKKYWKKFYNDFTNYLYDECGYYDNYAGSIIKSIRTFFNYLNKELNLGVGDFHKQFFVRKEDIMIHPLAPEELNFLIYDMDFENKLTPRMRRVKDFFVFGCTVGLRFSDLVKLKRTHLREVNADCYLSVRSTKTATDTSIKLPDYAIRIIQRQSKSKKTLLPQFGLSGFNGHLKKLLEAAGFTQPIEIIRSRRGVPVKLNAATRFCDLASSHTMRRTAITTMLSLGVPETVVRKISGHAPGSREFYRYVQWAQTYQDQETGMAFDRLKGKTRKSHIVEKQVATN